MAGHDGTWVAHPALVKVAKDVFDQHMKTPNQIQSNPGTVGASVTEADLLRLPEIPAETAITSAGLEKGVKIVMAYSVSPSLFCRCWHTCHRSNALLTYRRS